MFWSRRLVVVLLLGGTGLGLGVGLGAAASDAGNGGSASEPGAPPPTTERTSDSSVATMYPVVIRRPSGPPVIEVEHADGTTGSVSCGVCHTTRTPDLTNRTPADLTLFHQDMAFAHGGLSCYSCHHPDQPNALRLADQTAISYPDVMTLCSQCHGTQARDYAHGAHGGMTGYWDLSRGPRERNNCTNCHDPHQPAFPQMTPTFKPRDRFLTPDTADQESPHG
ncbi:MAG: cytochrome c3 family protein [Phycisphaerales bacterium]